VHAARHDKFSPSSPSPKSFAHAFSTTPQPQTTQKEHMKDPSTQVVVASLTSFLAFSQYLPNLSWLLTYPRSVSLGWYSHRCNPMCCNPNVTYKVCNMISLNSWTTKFFLITYLQSNDVHASLCGARLRAAAPVCLISDRTESKSSYG
jgi:hypothetical protein